MTVRITGLAELRAAFNTLEQPDRVEEALIVALGPYSQDLLRRAQTFSRQMPSSKPSRSEGRMAAKMRINKNKRGIRIWSNAPHAGPQEFGLEWERREHQRRNPGQGRKRKGAATGTVKAHTVTMHSKATPRALYKAVNQTYRQEEGLVVAAMDDLFRQLGFEVHG